MAMGTHGASETRSHVDVHRIRPLTFAWLWVTGQAGKLSTSVAHTMESLRGDNIYSATVYVKIFTPQKFCLYLCIAEIFSRINFRKCGKGHHNILLVIINTGQKNCMVKISPMRADGEYFRIYGILSFIGKLFSFRSSLISTMEKAF